MHIIALRKSDFKSRTLQVVAHSSSGGEQRGSRLRMCFAVQNATSRSEDVQDYPFAQEASRRR
jgi:hypothetical protein